MDKIKSGVPGLDTILKGGIRMGASVLVTGSPGTGKTILAIQFIVEGAKNNEPGIYITSEETIEDIREYATSLGYDLEKYEHKGLITLVRQSLSPKKLMSIATPLEIIKSKKVKRVVIDSITLFKYAYFPEEMAYRREVMEFISKMKELEVTLMAISETAVVDIDKIRYDPEDFLFSGLIILTKVRKGSSFEHCLTVAKMRGQDHLINIYPFTIGKGGLEVFPDQIPFSLLDKKW